MPGELIIDPTTFANMQLGRPFRSYRKTILGKVYVTMLDPFPPHNPNGYLISGDPKSDTAIVDTWNEMEDAYFRRTNKRQFELGNLIDYKRPVESDDKPQPAEQYSDEQLKDVLSKPFYSLQALVNKTNKVALVTRLLVLSREMNKSEKIVKFLEGRISEIQMAEYGPKE